jgi:hypothetical protein
MSAFELSRALGAVAGLADLVGGAVVTARRRWDRSVLQSYDVAETALDVAGLHPH